MIPIAVDTSE